MGNEGNDCIVARIKRYNDTLVEESIKKKRISELNEEIEKFKEECNQLENDRKQTKDQLQAEVYITYKEKDLLNMIPRVEKMSDKETANDFKNLVNKFSEHDLKVNDISQLHTYCKLYGAYVRKETSIIKGLFKALGGNLDD